MSLNRSIGRWDQVAILVNVVIGAGILGLPAKTFALIGPYSVPAWVLCALIMGTVAACFAEVGSQFTQTGGPYLYSHEVFGPAVGWIVGWLSWVSRLFSFATIMNLALTYAAGFEPALAGGVTRFLAIVALTTLLTLFVFMDLRKGQFVNNTLTGCKLVLLIGFAVAGLWWVDPSRLTLTEQAPVVESWQAAVMLMTFAFIGIESAMITSGEIKNPRRDVPFALAVGLSLLALLYISIQIVCIGTLPGLATSQRPLVDAAEQMFGPVGARIINAGALVTMCGTMFAILLTGSRLPFAFAERQQLPPVFGAVHPRFRTPYVAVLLTGICSGLLALHSSFLGALTVSALTRLVGYAVVCAALIVLRRRAGAANVAGFRLPGGPVVAVVAVAACVWLMLGISANEVRAVGLIALTGVVIGGIYATVRRSKARVARVVSKVTG